MRTPDYRHVSILWAAPEHAEDLATLHASLFPEPWDAASMHALLSHPGSAAFFARLGYPASPAGFILGRTAADEAELLSIGVSTEHQRHGIGRQLTAALVRTAKKANARRLFLEVGSNNVAALGLYRALGFEEIGRRKGYYAAKQGPAQDALTMSLPL
jgi:ribosomal-protein-alanine N-acetyltransferase